MDISKLKEGIPYEEAIALFDSLEPASADFMIGKWKGSEVPTGHIMDGFLTVAPWYGKFFFSAEKVYPLVFTDKEGVFYGVNPRKAFGLISSKPLLKAAKKFTDYVTNDKEPFEPHSLDKVFKAMGTGKSGARLREINFRGVNTAAMVYDELAIIDVFRKIDDNTVLGVMDIKGMDDQNHYCFLLERKGKH